MLVFTRRISETFVIGEDITVTVLGVKGNQVRIGIEAPAEVPIHRKEIKDRIDKEMRDRIALEKSNNSPKAAPSQEAHHLVSDTTDTRNNKGHFNVRGILNGNQ